MRYDFLLMIISILFIAMGYAKGKGDECNGERIKYVLMVYLIKLMLAPKMNFHIKNFFLIY